ncbi:N-acetylglucosaminylphosphatidylinositol deacetylase [Leptospira inadai serovar Lyme str. 10]|uniref:N-acetylglucosaminylphosphatidylinositol deacetylase n=2 Tax=Leptospira inadai serovar Lyme TaxID=293084 RepID=V6HIU5_9LEPT|nr:PIG-L deacetylase family protein [Leptospira inadai]EQA36690.1 N-acetylglucosaminylphosphatidylinositol deacetylase [Leptospira inadai serovar Lyme str. 10]PNV76503.1 GlcNAc-PI de-N-acetylase [Leptospira inadai serovar Lyme]
MKNKIILTVAAHPDDEILGCGGAMARFAEEGHEIHILILAEGLTSRDLKRDRDAKIGELSELSRCASNAGKILGVKSVELLDLPDNRMDSMDRLDIIKIVEKKIEDVRPGVIFTHFYNDLNVDHRLANEAVVTACRAFPGQTVKELYFFEVQSSTEWQIRNSAGNFTPNYFVSLSERQLQKKLSALAEYRSEMREFPHARSLEAVEALAKWRGASIGFPSAESFVLGRKIV